MFRAIIFLFLLIFLKNSYANQDNEWEDFVKSETFQNIYEDAKNGDEESVLQMIEFCFDEDSLRSHQNPNRGVKSKGLLQQITGCEFYNIDSWIDEADLLNIPIAQYYLYKREIFTKKGINYLHKAHINGLNQATLEYAELFSRFEVFGKNGVDVIIKAIEIKKSKRQETRELFQTLYTIYALGFNTKADNKRAQGYNKEYRVNHNNNKFSSYYDAITTYHFGLEGKPNYKKSLEYIRKTKETDQDYIYIRLIEAIHYFYGRGVDKDLTEAFQILNSIYLPESSIINFLMLLCIEEDEALDFFERKDLYKNRLHNAHYFYYNEMIANNNRDELVERALISFYFGDMIGARYWFESAADKNGIANLAFATELSFYYQGFRKYRAKLLEKSVFKKSVPAMAMLGNLYANNINYFGEEKINEAEILLEKSIGYEGYFKTQAYYLYCDAITNNNIFNFADGDLERICFYIFDYPRKSFYGIDYYDLLAVRNSIFNYHSNKKLGSLFDCIISTGSNNEQSDNFLKEVEEFLIILAQNGSVYSAERLYYLHAGRTHCFKNHKNPEEAAKWLFISFQIRNLYSEKGFVYFRDGLNKIPELEHLDLEYIDEEKYKLEAKNWVRNEMTLKF